MSYNRVSIRYNGLQMCGISGHIRFDGPANAAVVERITNRLSNRGPDGMGIYQHQSVCFGHRRLKIIDLSEKASQPMNDPQLGLSMVFNGCIYNYKELRAELEKNGYSFFSTSDTEVILKAYHYWKQDCLLRLNGMFAFAIHERDSNEVFLARDRLGIKPLYYTEHRGDFYFSSSLPSLLEIPNISTQIDKEALQYYFSFHSIVPPPLTILQGIRKLPQACWMRIKPNASIKIQVYWENSFQTPSEKRNWKFTDWKSELQIQLENAVKRRTVADVPVGVLLSGGVDSSLVVALLKKLGQSDIQTFSIGFDSHSEEEGNEFVHSDLIARSFETKHHKIQIDSRELLSHLDDCVLSMSEPMVSHDTIGFYLLSREVSKHVKVVQSGQGADELFAGYHWYPPLLDLRSDHAFERYRELFFDRTHQELNSILTPDFRDEDLASDFVQRLFQMIPTDSSVDKALYIDSNFMLVDDPVKRVDNMTMRWGLEARVPFLDHELAQFAAQIPAQFKASHGGKWILKELAKDFIPDSVINRPKGYFPVPQLKYVEGESLEMMKSILLSKRTKERGLYNSQYITKLLESPKDQLTPLGGSKLWQSCLLEMWLECQKI